METARERGQQAINPTENVYELQDSPIDKDHSSGNTEGSRAHAQAVEMDIHPAMPTTETGPTKPAMVWQRPDYSDLIVCEAPPPTWDNDKMSVVLGTGDKAHEGGIPLSPYLTDPVPEYTQRTSTQSQIPLNTKGEYAQWERSPPPVKEERVVFGVGMSKKRLSFIAIGIVAFILILLATVLGVTLTMKIVSKYSNTASTNAASNLLLDGSGISAINWTDSTGTERSAVFWQDSSNSILVSLRDSISNEWTQSNVTSALLNNTGASRFDVMSGTPLAAVTNRWQVTLYYLTSESKLGEIWASDIVGEVWFAGVLSSTLSPLNAMSGSHLSTFWQTDCTNCSNSLFVVFQDDSGTIQMANMTNNSWEFADSVDGVSSLSSTGLAVLPFTEDGGAGEFGTDPNALRLYSFDSTGLVESQNSIATNFTWEDETASTALSSTIATDASSQLAALSYGAHGLTNSLVNYLTPEGKILCYMYNGTVWTNGEPDISDNTSNFTAIAAAQDMSIYASFNGSIYEYQVDATNPLSWTKTSTVMVS